MPEVCEKERFFSHVSLDFLPRRRADHDGHHARSEALFYYVPLEDQVPENHLLRLIDKHVTFVGIGGG